jgi:hypothetical protein
MKSALIHMISGLAQALDTFYPRPDAETLQLLSAIRSWLNRHQKDLRA